VKKLWHEVTTRISRQQDCPQIKNAQSAESLVVDTKTIFRCNVGGGFQLPLAIRILVLASGCKFCSQFWPVVAGA